MGNAYLDLAAGLAAGPEKIILVIKFCFMVIFNLHVATKCTR